MFEGVLEKRALEVVTRILGVLMTGVLVTELWEVLQVLQLDRVLPLKTRVFPRVAARVDRDLLSEVFVRFDLQLWLHVRHFGLHGYQVDQSGVFGFEDARELLFILDNQGISNVLLIVLNR